jgi:hypothetical protein
VEWSHPESLAVGVGRSDSLVIHFSEGMSKGTVEDWVFFSPEVGRLRYSWDGPQLTIHPREPLKDETTYVILLSSNMEDRRRNPMGRPVLIPFSTGEQLDAGMVEGRVKTGRLKAAGAFVFAWPGEPVVEDSLVYPPAEISDAIRRGQADAEGAFVLSNLPVNERLTLCALYDGDGNRSYDPKGDLWGCLPEAVVLSDTLPELSMAEVYVVYPDEPGTVSGSVVDSLCVKMEDPAFLRAQRDSLRALLAPKPDSTTAGASDSSAAAAEESKPWEEWETWVTDTTALALTPTERARVDSLLAELEPALNLALEESTYCARPIWVEAYAHVDSPQVAALRVEGVFTLKELAPGEYWLRAHRDMNFDRQWNEGEPRSEILGPLAVGPARTLDGVEISLPSLPRPWPEDLLEPPRPQEAEEEPGGDASFEEP